MHLQKRVMVTGGAGFLGSFLCERLLNEGCDVVCVDNFYTGTKRNIVHLLDNPYFELIRHDVFGHFLGPHTSSRAYPYQHSDPSYYFDCHFHLVVLES